MLTKMLAVSFAAVLVLSGCATAEPEMRRSMQKAEGGSVPAVAEADKPTVLGLPVLASAVESDLVGTVEQGNIILNVDAETNTLVVSLVEFNLCPPAIENAFWDADTKTVNLALFTFPEDAYCGDELAAYTLAVSLNSFEVELAREADFTVNVCYELVCEKVELFIPVVEVDSSGDE
jgi:hypothetical protein